MAVAVAIPSWPCAGLWRIIRSWRYLPSGSRDSRLDLLRGYLIFAMVVDHMGRSSWLYAVTGGGQFVVSAAEGFVFLSGLVMGMVYQKVIHRDGLKAALRKALGRGLKLYALHAILTLGFVAASSIAGTPWYTPIEDRVGYVLGVLTLRQTYFLTDVLHLYAVLVLAAPIALLLLARRRTALVLLASGLLWAAYQRFPEDLSFVSGNASFPAAAWQLFFFTGLVTGYHRPRVWAFLGRIPRTPAIVLLSGAAAALVAQHLSGDTLFLTEGLLGQSYEELFYKWDVHLGRLIAAAVFFPLAYLLVSSTWRPLRAGLGWALLPLGQNALLAYSLHLFVVLATATALPLIPGFDGGEPALNTPVQLAGVGAIWVVVGAALLPRRAYRSVMLALGPDGNRRLPHLARTSLISAIVLSLTVSPVVATGEASALAGSGEQYDTPSLEVAAGGTLVESTLHSDILGRDLPYRIYLPPGYSSTAERYPVLYLLHGNGSNYVE